MSQYECRECENTSIVNETEGPVYCVHCGEFITDLTFERWDREKLYNWMREGA